jgi:hypothetical protein
MSDKIDFDAVAALALDIGSRLRLIVQFFPEDKEFLLKHCASASIHTTLFMKDIVDHMDGVKSSPTKDEKRFLDECGCKNEPSNSNV